MARSIRVTVTRAQTLGGNLDLSASGYRSLGEYDQAQAFTTGPDAAGYTLTSVEIALFSPGHTTFPGTVSIWTERNNRPGESLAAVVLPAEETLTLTLGG